MLGHREICVAPSILSADFGDLAKAVAAVRSETDWLHVDVMDGHFVPNLTIGPPVVSSLRRHSDAYFDCHLMMTNPDRYFSAFKAAGADLLTIHVEIGRTTELIASLRETGLAVGLALNPDTEIEEVRGHLGEIDLLLVMSVFPGFGGQQFMPVAIEKARALSEEIRARRLRVAIEVDGGIDVDTAPLMARAGAQIFVAGSAVFGSDDPARAVRTIADAVREASSDRGDRETAGGSEWQDDQRPGTV